MATRKSNVCDFYARRQKCPRKECRFSHGESSAKYAASSGAKHAKTPPTTSETELNAWKFLSKTTPKLLTVDKLSKFFQTGSKLIDTEAGIRQAAIAELASEGGLRRLRQMVDQEYEYESLQISNAFTEQINPLFHILTHPEVMASALNEEHIARICGYLYGIEGQRLLDLYGLILGALKELSSSPRLDVYLTVSLQVLAKVVEMKTEAQVNKRLHVLVDKLSALLKDVTQTEHVEGSEEQLDLYEATNLLARIQYRLGIGSALPTARVSIRPKAKNASFVMQQEPPGEPRRHNNDFEDMSQISIMPTYEEITSKRREYLPYKDLHLNHVQGLAGLFDRQFRLLREDTVGQIREAIKLEFDRLKQTGRTANEKPKGTTTYSYKNLKVERLVPNTNSRSGFKVEVSFDQPARDRTGSSENKRKEWWLRSKRLDPDALVSLVDSAGMMLFCIVDQDSKPKNSKPLQFRNHARDAEAEQRFKALYALPDRATIFLMLEDSTSENLKKLLTLCKSQPGRPSLSLVEFPRILLPAFKPTLLAFQQMKRSGDLALSQFLLPSQVVDEEELSVSPPAYTQKRGFRFNLKCLMKEENDLFFTPGHPFDVQLLVKGSQLDEAQSKALINALCRCVGLIQGPPGTGKSFVGVALIRVLLANRAAMRAVAQRGQTVGNDIGPIIIVTYTNHAGDQLGEHLHNAGVENIIRIGGGSKSEVLQDCNLRVVARKEQRTQTERRLFAKIHEHRETEIDSQFEVLKKISSLNSSNALKDFILFRYPHHHKQLFERTVDADGFQKVKSRQAKNPQNILKTWPSEGGPSSGASRSVKVLKRAPLSLMSKDERYKLRHAWEREFHEELEENLMNAVEAQTDFKLQKDAIDEETNLRCLRTANLIIMTTSGLANNLSMLQKLQSKVLVCEEAGEVLEAHLLTTFLPSIEHAILIGDHQQLRPQVQNHDLSSASDCGAPYSLDISLFERLVHPGPGIQRLPYSTLETQRRMHPSISQLIRGTLYPTLKDAEHVKDYPSIVGLRKRLFWLDHTEPEAERKSEADKTSHWNSYEVKMTTELVHHLVRQGEYQADEIAVLTPYLGQLTHLRDSLGSSFAIVLGDRDLDDLENAGINPSLDSDNANPEATAQNTSPIPSQTTLLKALRLATVDNFQGEEAKIIVLSLVRSNAENKCGFLKTSNRINVALSRAQHGMIIIGNSRTASARVEMWANIAAELAANGNIGSSLELQCPRHPDTIVSVTTPDDIPKLSPDGGCGLKCVNRLSCGHACPARCHSKVLHAAVHCAFLCPRSLKGCDHSCPKRCGDACPEKCQTDVFDATRILPCGHKAENLPCWQSQDVSLVKCTVKVSRTIPGCGHTVEEFCHVDVGAYGYKCKVKQCGAILPCGHTCLKKCKDCVTRITDGNSVVYNTDHGKCQHPCGRPFSTCSHSCTQPCHGDQKCPPCNSSCSNACSHSRCSRLCSEPCRLCADEHCASGCEHSRCTLPCSAPCNHVPCEERCKKFLSCGHQCPSICGETCPPFRFCHTCTKDPDIRTTMVDFIEGLTYEKIDLDGMPVIFPSCGHFLTAQSMDGQMFMGNYYEKDVDDKITGLKPTLSFPFSMDEIKRCGTCRGSLRSVSRYGRLIRRAMLDEATKRFILWSKSQYMPLAKAMQVEQDALAQKKKDKMCAALKTEGLALTGSSQQQMQAIRKLHGQPYPSLLNLRQKIIQHRQAVDVEEQPFKQVLSAVQNQRRRREGIVSDLELDDSLMITSAGILATSLLLRCELVVLSDLVEQCKRASNNRNANIAHFAFDYSKNKKVCDALVTSAIASSNPLQACEGHIFSAHFTALELHISSRDTASSSDLHKAAVARLDAAKMLKEQYNGQTRPVHAEIDSIEKMLNGGTFYTAVTSEEMREAFVAMSTEFSGTGHWYTCENGHPFTIGECGMPMEQACCPQCGAVIGGQHHQAVAGTTHATDLEQQFGNLAV